MEVFAREVVLRWMESSKVTAVAWCYNSLVIGNDAGELYAFQASAVESPVEPDEYKFAKVSGRSIARICPLEPQEWLLVLNANGDLYAVNAFFKGKPALLAKNVTCVARNLGEARGGAGEEGRSPNALRQLGRFCLGADGKVSLYAAEGDKLVLQRSITVDGVVLSASWLDEVIVVGTREAYYVVDAEGATCHELCSNVPTGDDQGDEAPALTAACTDGDVMVVCQNIGIFYNTETLSLSRKNTIHWRNWLEALGCVPPFVIGVTVDRLIEVYGVRDQLLYQTIDQTNARLMHYMPERGAVITATPNVVAVLKPNVYHQCLAEVIERKDIAQALHLVDLYFSPGDAVKGAERRIAHTVAGWVRFSDLNFPLAFQHFTLGEVDIVHLLTFWNHYAEVEVPESHVRNAEVPPLLRRFIPGSVGIGQFVEQRYRELKDVLPPKTTASKLLEMANVSFAAFLLKHFSPKALMQKSAAAADDFSRRLVATIEKTNLLLLAECDDPKCSVIINRPQEETFLDLDVCGEHLVRMNKSEVLARLLIKKERYKEAMEIMARYVKDKLGSTASEEATMEIKSVCCQLASCLNMLIETSQRDSAEGNMGAMPEKEINEILNTHLPILLASYPNAALDVLTKNHAMLPFSTDEVIAMIGQHAPQGHSASNIGMRIKYLEDLVITKKRGSRHENTLLAKHYISELIAHKKAKDAKGDSVGRTLWQLLESNSDFDMAELEAALVKLDVVEASVLVHNKFNRHEAALRTLFERWDRADRLKVCEAYCLCFGDVEPLYDAVAKETPFKRFFSNFDYWMGKAGEWPLAGHHIYRVNSSDTSIDRLLLQLLVIIVDNSEGDAECVYLARDLLAKYMPLCMHHSVLNGSAIVELIPEEWNFAVLAPVFTQLQLKALHEQRTMAMKRGLTRSLRSQTARHLYKLTCVPPITIDASSACAICQEPIKIGMSIAIPPPNQKEGSQRQGPRQHRLMHEQCAKSVHDK